ncbi:MAG: ferritin-like domain-containing protein [Nocardioidaceae bacterium]
MFGKTVVRDMIERSSENETDRRRFLQGAGVAGLGVIGASTLGGLDSAGAASAPRAAATTAAAASAPISDGAVLNFALNLEYLEAEFYSYASFGHGLDHSLTTGKGNHGGVTGGRKVHFATPDVAKYAREIAHDEIDHVRFLRKTLGAAKVSRPSINIKGSFTAAARAAGLIGAHQTFDPYSNENNFLLAAFIFEDVGVTAYKGAAPLIDNKTYLEAAAGILAVEAYHAAIIRTNLYGKGLQAPARAISAARDSLDGNWDDDRGIGTKKRANLVPTDHDGIAFSRSADRVLNVVYLTPKKATRGGFFPHGVNGVINTSGPKPQ